MRAQFTVSSPMTRTPRVMQISSLFDVAPEYKLSVSVDVTLPLSERPWNVGLITGPSGAGKSLLAAHLWPGAFVKPGWDDRAVVDNFPASMGIKEVTALLGSVGLGSTPAWLRPHSTLSNGEAFRADMARLLAESGSDKIAVVDEFTSLVDRQVAKVASHTVQKAVRKAGRQLVAVTCHSDVVDWLNPDWIVELPAGRFTWRSKQRRPELGLEVYAIDRSAWSMFAKHHYMSPVLSSAAQCFGGWVDGELAAFDSYLHFPHAKVKNLKIGHRLVVLPDYQGLGLAGHMSEWMGDYLWARKFRYRIITGHPAFLHYLRSSPRWRSASSGKVSFAVGPRSQMKSQHLNTRRLVTASFEYTPPRRPGGSSASLQHPRHR